MSVSGPFVILVIRVQVNMMVMMMVLMMAPERAESPSCRQQEEEKRCFPASARTPHASARSQKYIILCLFPFIGCCVLGGGVQVRSPTNEGQGLQFTTSKILSSFYPLLPKTSLLNPPQPNQRSYSGLNGTRLSFKNYDSDVPAFKCARTYY